MRADGKIKTVLIILLAVTAFYMLLSLMASVSVSTESSLKRLPDEKLNLIKTNGTDTASAVDKNRICPVAICAKNGGQEKLLFAESGISEAYFQIEKELSELVCEKAECLKASEEQWKECFEAEKYVYIDFGTDIPSAAIAVCLAGGDTGYVGPVSAIIREMFIIYSEEVRAVCRSSHNSFYSITADENFSVEPTVFAYTDSAESLPCRLSPESFGTDIDILGTVISDTVIFDCITMQKSNEKSLYPLFEMLGYNTGNLNSYYYGVNKSYVYIGQQSEIEVECDTGKISLDTDEGGIKLKTSGDKADGFAGCYVMADEICTALSKLSKTDGGGLYLAKAAYVDGSTLEFSYEYRYKGVKVILNDTYPLTVSFKDDKLVKLTFIPISLKYAGEQNIALPKDLMSDGNRAVFGYYPEENSVPCNAEWRYEKGDEQ